jgi:hypothetical protein
MSTLSPAQRRHKSWLWVTAIVIGVFGPVFTLGTVEATSEPARLTLQLLSGPGYGAREWAGGTLRFLSALTGGFLFGWGVTIWGLRRWVYDAAPDGTRRAVVAGLCAWFLLDSLGSVLSGTPWNAVFNVLVLLLAVGPMWRRADA